MAGHSHSANIKHRKGRVDAARAKVFSKLARMVTVAAKLGGPDPDANARLRLAIDKARMASMPKDNIERAIKKGAGGMDVGDYEEILYEGYGPCGVAIMLEALTDNRNRTAPELRKEFERGGGNLGATGAVAWMFERKGVIAVDPESGADEDAILEAALLAGAEDLVNLGDGAFEIRCQAGDLETVRAALDAGPIAVQGGEVRYLPSNQVVLENVDDARKVLKLVESLDDHDDVQSVYANYTISDDIAAQLEQES
ncbi:MAG: YebC/PmpR family DNA-binding transcriptional regulator [Planctomycetes bacterium]|nr:YebC/PmpR family DNA-binding transcriptional regulator [Planctomycetota bacterium]